MVEQLSGRLDAAKREMTHESAVVTSGCKDMVKNYLTSHSDKISRRIQKQVQEEVSAQYNVLAVKADKAMQSNIGNCKKLEESSLSDLKMRLNTLEDDMKATKQLTGALAARAIHWQ